MKTINTALSAKDIDDFANKLKPHYAKFNVAERLLFTGHSHQAWPDSAFDFTEYSDDVANNVDEKWGLAFAKTDKLRRYLKHYYDDSNGRYSLAQNTHQLLCSFLSALNLQNGGHIITTNGEFHSMARQLKALKQAGVAVSYADVSNNVSLAEQVENLIQDNTVAVLVSRVFFINGKVNTELTEIAALLKDKGIYCVIDDYHGTNVLPLSLQQAKLEQCYLLTGGYKYLQWGEGNCFLRFPKNCPLKPIITGWFSSFNTLTAAQDERIEFDEGDNKFVGSTYDPISQYRACRVVDFFAEQNITPEYLWQCYAFQRNHFRQLIANSSLKSLLPDNSLKTGQAGFVSLFHPQAAKLQKTLLDYDVFTDCRGPWLRFGFAPYISTDQIQQAVATLEKILAKAPH